MRGILDAAGFQAYAILKSQDREAVAEWLPLLYQGIILKIRPKLSVIGRFITRFSGHTAEGSIIVLSLNLVQRRYRLVV